MATTASRQRSTVEDGGNPAATAGVVKHESLAAALAAFQLELPRIGKDKRAEAGKYGYSYADLAAVSAAVLPLLGRHGLSFSARPTISRHHEDGDAGDVGFVLAYTLRHDSGESVSGVYPLPAPTISAQQMGSAITYARRYCLLAVTGAAPEDEDDDGAQAPPARQHDDARARVERSLRDDPAATPATRPQLGKVYALLRQLNLSDKETALPYISDKLKHKVESTADLSMAEAHRLIEELIADAAKQSSEAKEDELSQAEADESMTYDGQS